MTKLFQIIILMGLFLSINTFAIPFGTHSDDLRSEVVVDRLLHLRPGITHRVVTSRKGNCYPHSRFADSESDTVSMAFAICNTGEIAIAGGIAEVFDEACGDQETQWGHTMSSFRYSDQETTWFVRYYAARVTAYAVCVSKSDL